MRPLWKRLPSDWMITIVPSKMSWGNFQAVIGSLHDHAVFFVFFCHVAVGSLVATWFTKADAA